MANKYSRFELKPYESQYVDPGSVQVAGVLRKRYDDNMSSYNMLNRAANSINTLEGDRHIKQNAINKVESDFQRTIEVGNFENAGRVVSDATNDFIGNRGLQLAQQSYQTRQAEMEMINKLRAQGKQVLDFNEIRNENGEVIGHRTDAHNSYYQDPNTGEMVENVYRPGSEMMLDYTQRMETLLQGIKASGAGSVTKSDILGYVKTLQSQGVSRSRAYKVVEQALDAYIDSDEGTQDYRRLTEIEGMSDEDAKLDMINRMQGVVEKQIHMITKPSYMKDLTYSVGGGSGNKGYDYINGAQVARGDVEQFSDLIFNMRDLKNKLQNTPTNSDKYNEYRSQLDVLEEKKKLYIDQVAANHPELQASLNKGREAMGEYSILEDMFFNMTNDEDYGGSFIGAFGGFFLRALEWANPSGIGSGFREGNMSSIWDGDADEIENLAEMFDRKGAIEHINKHYGTDYTEADLPKIKEAATKYFKWMQEEGNETAGAINDLTTLKQSDRIIFSYDNVKNMNAVNTQLKQIEWNDLNFVFQSEEEAQEAAEAWEDWKRGDAPDSSGAESKIYFAGMTVPSQGETGKVILSINGKRHIATFKSADQYESVSSGIYDAMGANKMKEVQQQAQKIEDDNMTNKQMLDVEMADLNMRIINGDKTVQKDLELMQKRVQKSVAAGLGMSYEDFISLPPADQQTHIEAWYAKQYQPK